LLKEVQLEISQIQRSFNPQQSPKKAVKQSTLKSVYNMLPAMPTIPKKLTLTQPKAKETYSQQQ
jgi:hypothetical protein